MSDDRIGSANGLQGEEPWTAQPEQHGIPPMGLLNCTISLLSVVFCEPTGNGPGAISTQLIGVVLIFGGQMGRNSRDHVFQFS